VAQLPGLLFETLTRHYDLVLQRRSTLSGQASSLMTFAGIIETILVGSLTALATSQDARIILSASQDYPTIVWGIGLGFAMYLVTAILAILSYRETLWIPAPVIVEGKNPKEWRKILDQIHQTPQTLSIVGLEMQLVTAIEKHQHTNDEKYKLLLAGYVFLIAGILFTAITGCLFLRGLAPV
jgi:hypothetical protein